MLARIAAGENIPSTPCPPHATREGERQDSGNVGRGWVRRTGGGYTSSGRMGHGANDDCGRMREGGVDSVKAGQGKQVTVLIADT